MIKKIMLIVIILLITALTFPNQEILAKDLIKQIDEGRDIKLNNCTITGDLMFISVKDTELKRKNLGLFNKQKEYLSHIRVNVAFENCVFKGDIIAYFSDDLGRKLNTTDFHKDAIFIGCTFKGKSAFKYSKFFQATNFRKCEFHEDALFKYAKFSNENNYSGSVFYSEANFKYTKFRKKAYFENIKFKNEANFKYTKFNSEAFYKDSEFNNYANFKYTEFSGLVDFTDNRFFGESNFKYTKFRDGVNFNNAIFEGYVDMKYTRFNRNNANFDGSKFKRGLNSKYCKIDGEPLKIYLARKGNI